MNSIQIVAVIVSCCVGLLQAASLPDFITPCKGTDPNLSQCAEIEANKVIPKLINGYPSLNIPVLSPLKIEQIKVENSGQLSIVINDALVRGLEDAKVSKFNMDFNSHIVHLRLNIPNLNIQGEYEMAGQLLVLPINGKGACNITAVNGDFDIDVSYTLYDKDGVQYAKIEKVDVVIDIKDAHLYFANLLNAKKQVSDDINALLNKEWRQVIHDLEPAIKEAVSLIVTQVVNGIIDKVPFAEVFGNELP
ncbi:circadian clock-controlled protein daywake-like [Chrysoperla carnea]|uniref:circadian clock-controlled protein daywake-like n=1 Tax=Chrysoperla carnea TaxID=189513 RepID=UPI001D076F1A|nr:circadian clock-controlled protein daywake-like [Chrysoperla carnea]